MRWQLLCQVLARIISFSRRIRFLANPVFFTDKTGTEIKDLSVLPKPTVSQISSRCDQSAVMVEYSSDLY